MRFFQSTNPTTDTLSLLSSFTIVATTLAYANLVEYGVHRYLYHEIIWLKQFRKYHAVVHHGMVLGFSHDFARGCHWFPHLLA
jgi:hypothetical protein